MVRDGRTGGVSPGRRGRQSGPELASWRKAPVAAQFLAASMIAIGEVIYGPKEQPAIIAEAPGAPPGDEGLEVHLDPDRPEESVIVVPTDVTPVDIVHPALFRPRPLGGACSWRFVRVV